MGMTDDDSPEGGIGFEQPWNRWHDRLLTLNRDEGGAHVEHDPIPCAVLDLDAATADLVRTTMDADPHALFLTAGRMQRAA
jgi:hypothetical protein